MNSTTRERADRFRCEVANVPDHDHSPDGPNARKDENGVIHVETPAAVSGAWRRVYNLFHDLLPTYGNPDHERRNTVTDAAGMAWENPDDPCYVTVYDIPPKLRLVWNMPTAQSRKMFLMCEVAYYLRDPAMMLAASKASKAQMEEQGPELSEKVRRGRRLSFRVFVGGPKYYTGNLKTCIRCGSYRARTHSRRFCSARWT